jgi:hypothetical protein
MFSGVRVEKRFNMNKNQYPTAIGGDKSKAFVIFPTCKFTCVSHNFSLTGRIKAFAVKSYDGGQCINIL